MKIQIVVDCARYIINLVGKYTISDLNKEMMTDGRKVSRKISRIVLVYFFRSKFELYLHEIEQICRVKTIISPSVRFTLDGLVVLSNEILYR